MPCVCEQCRQHSKTLGLAGETRSKAAIHKAFRAAAKLWHPDRFENDSARRLDAEEHFKHIQVAFRELTEHHEHPEEWPAESTFQAAAKRPPDLHIRFDDASGCYSAPDFPPYAQKIVASHFIDADRAVAIVDLSGSGSRVGTFAQYILLTTHGIFVRNALNMVSLIWYNDLGEIRLIDQRRNGKLGFWQTIAEKISGIEQKYSLQICRRDGTVFFSITGEQDDSVKKILYSFLMQRTPRKAN